jgi:hypothetical protein
MSTALELAALRGFQYFLTPGGQGWILVERASAKMYRVGLNDVGVAKVIRLMQEGST